jgi:hypothetical protein
METEERAKKLGIKSDCVFVAWCDVMGGGSIMRSVHKTAIYRVIQFQRLVLLSLKSHDAITVIPINDGVFLVSQDFDDLYTCLQDLLQRIVRVNLNKAKLGQMQYLFLARASVAYGPVTLGNDPAFEWEEIESIRPGYSKQLVIGLPVIQAYESESKAPPLGILLHETVLAQIPSMRGPFARWQPEDDIDVVEEILQRYFSFQIMHQFELGFDAKKAEHYIAVAREYFKVPSM